MTSNANELLSRALDELNWLESPGIVGDIRAFLASEQEAEPFGRLEADLSPPSGKGPFTNVDDLMKALRKDNEKEAEPVACVNTPLSMVYPEYNRHVLGARPEPSRKPMTEEEAIELCPFTREEFKAGFLTGVRFAEKHHGIGGDDGNHK